MPTFFSRASIGVRTIPLFDWNCIYDKYVFHFVVHVYISHSCSWMLSVPRFASGQLESVSLSLSAGLFSFVGEKCMHLYVEFGPPRRELPKSKKFLKVKNIKEEEYWMKSGAWRGVFSLHNTSKIYEELFQIGLSVLPLNLICTYILNYYKVNSCFWTPPPSFFFLWTCITRIALFWVHVLGLYAYVFNVY